MKHLRLFEDNKFTMWSSTVDSFNDFLREIKPIVLWKYKKLAMRDDYFPEWGATPEVKDDYNDELSLFGAYTMKDGSIEFELYDYDKEGQPTNQFYVNLTEEEMEQAKIDIEGKKYNL